jgi:hypothetical protein
MYTIIGGDGREYGPVSTEQVRQWMAGGRANGQTRAKLFGTEEWKTLHDFPEFNPTSAGAGFEPSFGEPPAVSDARSANPANFDPLDCFSRSWALLKRNFWPSVGVCVMALILVELPSVLLQLALPHLGLHRTHSGLVLGGAGGSGTRVDLANLMTPMASPVFWLALWLPLWFTQPLTGGLVYYFVKKARGEAADLSDLFAGFRRGWLSIVVAATLCLILISLGMICLVLPGIYLAVAYMFVNLVIIDQRCGFWEAMEISRRAITRRWWAFLLLLIVGGLFAILGFCALFVGIFVASPLILGAIAYAYLDLVPRPSSPAPQQVIQGDLPSAEGEQNQPSI